MRLKKQYLRVGLLATGLALTVSVGASAAAIGGMDAGRTATARQALELGTTTRAASAPNALTSLSTGVQWFGSFGSWRSATTWPYANYCSTPKSGSGISCMSGITGPHVIPVSDPLGSGNSVLDFDVNDGDVPYNGSTGARADIHSPQLLTQGADFYVSVPLMFPSNFPTVNSAWFQVAEIYGPPTGAAPPVAIDLYHTSSGDHLSVARGGYGQVMQFPTLTRNHWHTVVLHVRMATDNTGYVQSWYDGVQQKALGGSCAAGSTTCYYPTMASHNSGGPNWLQINSYRKYGGYPGDVTLYHGAPAIGNSYAAVMSTVTNAPYGP